mgnify:CR=1 FL=1
MAVITSDPILIDNKSFVTKTDGNTATVVRISKGKAITQTEKEVAGDYYNSTLDEIDYAKIYNLKFGKNWIAKHGASDEWMAKALSDKSWKDIFKKATDKKSPNISFASIAESNLNWQSIVNNTDANNRPTSSGKTYGRYPINKDSKPFDYLQVSALEYRPQQFKDLIGKDPSTIFAVVGGGSNFSAIAYPYYNSKKTKLYGVERAGLGIKTGKHGATIVGGGKMGILLGMQSKVLLDGENIAKSFTAASGLDFASQGPEVAYMHSIGKIKFLATFSSCLYL